MPVQISDQTRQTLMRFMPKWMKILEAVNFNIQKLDGHLIFKMEISYPFCFIGEGRKNNDYASPNEKEYCEMCSDLADITPAVFGSTLLYYKKLLLKYKKWSSFSGGNIQSPTYKKKKLMFNRTDKGKSNFLTFIAEHLQKNHEVIA